jgi:hypothetical protein
MDGNILYSTAKCKQYLQNTDSQQDLIDTYRENKLNFQEDPMAA